MIITHGLLDGQVLQRQRNDKANATVRGTCGAAGTVIATITSKGKPLNSWKGRVVGRASRGVFTATLKGIPVGGPYEIKLSVVGESVTTHCIWVGDVWLLSGQSNMQGCGNLSTAPKPHPLVHAMYMDDHWGVAREPIHFLADSPDKVHWLAYGTTRPSKAERDKLFCAVFKGVGPGIFFGKEMVKRSGGVPQGLLATAHGGTSMEQWDPAKRNLGGDSLYGSMLRTWRKTGQPIAGLLWYQGESDCIEQAAPLYAERMKKFVAAVRRDLKQPRLPFLLVQIGRVFGVSWNGKLWNSVQDQQVKLKRHIRNFDVVTAVDLPLDDMIHVSSEGYARLGVRLARLADRVVYGNRRELPAPELVTLEPKQTTESKKTCPYRIVLRFKNVVGGLRTAGEPSGFALVDDNHNNSNAFYKTTLKGDEVILEASITNNLGEYKLMYGHGCAPRANITDSRDMALPVFGPELIERRLATTPFIYRWLVSSIQPAGKPVAKLPAPKPQPKLGLQKQEFTASFVDQHLSWEGRQGQAFFFSEVTLAESMKLNLRVGYDGPIKVWVDGKPVFCDPNGTNPAVPDQGIKPISLREGKHKLSVAMDLNDGKAWGFFLRFNRRDVNTARIAKGDYAVPVCSL